MGIRIRIDELEAKQARLRSINNKCGTGSIQETIDQS